MKENKLTIEDAMKYPNAVILDYTSSKDSPTEYKNIFKYIYSCAEFDGANIQHTKQEDFNDYYISNCKLILRSIESLTDEEKDKLNMIYRKHSLRPLASDKQYDDIRFYAVLIDYLRSISVDIDGLEKQGVAVYE